MKDMRPISLCNVVYKIIAKAMANRLKEVLRDIISPNRATFIPGRLITDNVVLGFECIHAINNKRLGREGFIAMKLDMSNAYDRVEWDYLDKVMDKMGFSDSWRNKVMRCISSVFLCSSQR